MDKVKLEKYAELVAKVGARVQKGEEVWIMCGLDQPEFIYMLVEKLYQGGAAKVEVQWNYDKIAKLHNKYMTVNNLAKLTNYNLARWKYRVKKMPTTIWIDSDDPDAMKGINQAKAAKARMKSYPKIKPFRDAMEGQYKWTIAAVPGKAWAKKVFPNVSEEEAVELLWEAIFKTSRVDDGDPIENWNKHNEYLTTQSKKLHDLKLVELRYKSESGTDFKVGLIPGMNWGAGIEKAPKFGWFNPNIPTEEVFTSPYAGKAEGLLVASKPLSYNGELIEDFSIRFENGRAVEVKARKGQKLLEHMISMDEGAAKLGEVALIPYDSPIRESGILFYNTLFDENAACHVALGTGFPECLPGGLEMTPEEVQAHGVNNSMIHVDFMIGTKDLDIVGIDEDGKEIQIFKNGNWAI